MAYTGDERRVHKVFITRNTEYHLRARHCVAVRDRESGEWMDEHLAISAEVQGALRFHDNGGISPNKGKPRVGESLFFCSNGRDVVTSAILSVIRPPKATVSQYRM